MSRVAVSKNGSKLFRDSVVRASRVHVGMLSTALAMLLVTPVLALADEPQRHNYSIAGQALSGALKAFAFQSGREIFFTSDLTAGKVSSGCSGDFDDLEALERILRGTGLTYTVTASKAILVQSPKTESRRIAHIAYPDKRSSGSGPSPPEMSDGNPAVLQEVIVTARRLEENVQRVPVAVTVIGAEQLRRQDMRDFWTLQSYVPGLTASGPSGHPGFTTLRGLVGVVSYFADAPLGAGPAGLQGFANAFDLGNVQILKGPQGTLFGTASNAGAVLYQPRKPGPVRAGYIALTAGTYNRRTIDVAVDLPFMDEKLLTRIAVEGHEKDGYITDVTTGRGYGNQSYWVARVSAVLRPAAALENYTVVQYYSSHERTAPLVMGNQYNPALVVNTGLAELERLPGGLPAVLAAAATQARSGPYRVNGLSVAEGSWERDYLLRNTTTWQFSGKLALKNILGFQHLRSRQLIDADGTPLPINDGDESSEPLAASAWSEDLQLQGTTFGDKLSFTLGTFHTRGYSGPAASYTTTLGTLSGEIARNSNTGHALYAQGTWDLSSLLAGLSLTAGYRYSWDSIYQRIQRLDAGTRLPERDLSGTLDSRGASYTLGLQYQLAHATMLFVTNSKGYSAGGLNLNAPAGFQSYRPASLNNLEAGIKSTFALGRALLRTNFSAYYGWYDNVQVSVLTGVQIDPAPAPKSLLAVIQNAAVAHIEGIDAEVTLVPIAALAFTGAVAYADDVYDRWNTLNPQGNVISMTGVPFTYLPKMKYVLGGTWHLPVPRNVGEAGLSLAWSHTDRYYSPAGLPMSQIYRVGGTVNPPLDNLDLSFDWHDIFERSGLSAQIFVLNATNNSSGTTAGGGGYLNLGYASFSPAEPRRYGAQLRYSF